jgi:hypothetical protein
MKNLQSLLIDGFNIIWDQKIYVYEGFEKIDPMVVHIIMGGNYYLFIGGETQINGVMQQDADEIISTLPTLPVE